VPNKEINVPICGVFNLNVGLGADTTGCETLVKRDTVLVVIVRVALHRDNAVAEFLGLGWCRGKSLV
jgi:hypothetical protein